jgi:acyl carrier protein
MDNRTKIEKFIIDELLTGNRAVKIDPDESLIQTGILDSLSLLRMVSFIEEEFGIVVEDDELNLDNLESFNKIINLIERKTNGS